MSVIYEPRGRAREYAALAANLYAGCEHGCVYCYAPSAVRRARDDFHGAVKPRKNILAGLEKDAERLAGSKDRVLLSFTTDPYQPIEEELGITREAIKILHRHGLHVEILTKGGTRAARDFDLLMPGDAFATTLTFLDEDKSREWEPKAALPGVAPRAGAWIETLLHLPAAWAIEVAPHAGAWIETNSIRLLPS